MLAIPENRLVIHSLKSNWNQKLKELEKAEQNYAIYSSKIWIPSEKVELNILNLAQKFRKSRIHQHLCPKKKQIIHVLIDDITVLAEKRYSNFSIDIRFLSGKYEQLF